MGPTGQVRFDTATAWFRVGVRVGARVTVRVMVREVRSDTATAWVRAGVRGSIRVSIRVRVRLGTGACHEARHRGLSWHAAQRPVMRPWHAAMGA